MKIRAVDIARELNLSKATVSLALNNKPGVSASTRQAVLSCQERLIAAAEAGVWNPKMPSSCQADQPEACGRNEVQSSQKQCIKIIVATKRMNIIGDPALGIWNDVFRMFKKELERLHYRMSIEYVDLLEDEQRGLPEILDHCRAAEVAGVILYATEMHEYDFKPFRHLNKPLLVFDNYFGDRYHSVVIDNFSAIRNVVDYLAERGYRDIRYLAQNRSIYNFEQRREGFKEGLRKNHLKSDQNRIVPVGTSVEEITENMSAYLDTTTLPEVFILENYQVSLGVIQAFSEKKIRVPKDVSLIGMDMLPENTSAGIQLRTINIDHAEKAIAAVMLLQKEIEQRLPMKLQILVKCEMDFGNSIR